MHACDNQQAAEVVIEINLTGSSQANRSWTFVKDSGDPDVGVDPTGSLDFHTKHQPIWVQMTLKLSDPAIVFYSDSRAEVLGFMDVDEGSNYDPQHIVPVGPNHAEIKHIALSDDKKTVTFCYMNKEHNPYSRYAIYLGDATHPPTWTNRWIDPRISNGQ
ncbi:MAG TPA: hypothetical protein VKT30_14135 [Caulobacteraceae bacterium]|nr:hypothetical protein [Caulobacteraceae bacterium]